MSAAGACPGVAVAAQEPGGPPDPVPASAVQGGRQAGKETSVDVRLAHLFEQPALRPAVARLIHHEFWLDRPDVSADHLQARLSAATGADAVPISRIALADGALVGTVNLIDCDDDARTHLWPWLAAMVVVPAWRGRGIGSLLVRTLMDDARRLGINQMFLGTDGPGFYRRLGAETHEQVRADFVIMRLPVPAR